MEVILAGSSGKDSLVLAQDLLFLFMDTKFTLFLCPALIELRHLVHINQAKQNKTLF